MKQPVEKPVRPPRHRARGVRAAVAITAAASLIALTGCSPSATTAGGKTTIEFAQWWEPELPAGALTKLVDQFESENPDIDVKLLSNPYASTQQQIFSSATAGTMPDVVGLDGSWVNQLSKQGALADLGDLMKQNSFDTSTLTNQVKVDDKTYSVNAVNFPYVLYTNDDLLKKAGIAAPPKTRSEFLADAKVIKAKAGVDATTLPLGLTDPSGIQIAVLNWLWASGGTMLTSDLKPDVTNEGVTSLMTFIKQLYDDGSVAPGAFTTLQQDMVQNFTNGKTAMMIDSPAHLNGIQEGNADLHISLSQIPLADGYTGQPGAPTNAWGIGVSQKSAHQDAAFKLVAFLMGKEVNAQLSSAANAFPGNSQATPDFTGKSAGFKSSYEIYKTAKPIENQFSGLPQAQELMRTLDQELQTALDGKQTVEQALTNTQEKWTKVF